MQANVRHRMTSAFFIRLSVSTSQNHDTAYTFNANSATSKGKFLKFGCTSSHRHRLYSHGQKRGRAKETSALSTSTTEIPLRIEDR